MPRYNLKRLNPNVETPRTTRYNRRQRQQPDLNSSDEDDRWRANYRGISEILHENYYGSDSESSEASESSSIGSQQHENIRHIAEPSSSSREGSTSSSNAHIPIINDRESISESSNDSENRNEVARRYVREVLLEELDDENASEDDLMEYENIIQDRSNNIVQNKLNELLESDEVSDIINARVNVTKLEMLLSVLKFTSVYYLPQSAIADLFKLLNISFGTSIFPQSRYLIDQLFNFQDNIDYFALCPNCMEFVTSFNREQDVNAYCNPCNLQFSLRDPTYTDFFCIINPQWEIVHYLEENWSYYEFVVQARADNHQDINEFYDGLLYKQLRNSLPDHKKDRFVTATFNSDASPVFQSSAFSVTPIQIIINELPFALRTSKPIVCGLWFGKRKLDTNVFFKPFVARMNAFTDDGMVCNVRGNLHTIYLYAICSCDDSVARAPMQGLTQYNGYYGCNWCLHPGYYIAVGKGGSVKYILIDDPVVDRNDADTRQHMREAMEFGETVYGVNNQSVLTDLRYFDIILGFVPDPMHFLDLGIGKQFMKYWFDIKNMPYSLTNAEINLIDYTLKALKVPNKLVRNCRSIRDRKHWKAREIQNWILYYSTIVLLMIPRMRCYAVHWSYLVKAYYILLQNNITRDQLREAHRLLTIFVALTEFYYARTAMTFNVHQLLHVVQSVVNWGPLHSHSGYGFENGNGHVVKQVQAAKGVLYQLCRVIGMRRSELVLKQFLLNDDPESNILLYVEYLEKKECAKVLKTNIGRYFGTASRPEDQWIVELNLSESAVIYYKLVKMECSFLSCNKGRLRSNNSFAKTVDNRFIQIVFFIVDRLNEQEYTICKSVNVINIVELDNYHPDFQIKRIVSIDKDLQAIPTRIIDRICVYMNCADKSYLCAIPNMHSY